MEVERSSCCRRHLSGKRVRMIAMLLHTCVVMVLSPIVFGAEDSASPSTLTPATHTALSGHTWRPELTPRWNLSFSEGEKLSIDCGVYTGGDPVGMDVSWTGPGGRSLEALYNNRVTFSRRTKNHRDDTKPGDYYVVTFTLANLTSTDSGVYTCVSKRGNETKSTKTRLKVMSPIERCGFEGDDLCGWKIDTSKPFAWQIHDATHDDVITRTKGSRFDHTYGASKHIGHFLDLDVQHYDTAVPNKSTASVESPLYKPHTVYKCFQFWYSFEGRDQIHLDLSLHHANDSADVPKQLWRVSNTQGNAWKLAQVQISPQQQNYHLIFDAMVCPGKCKLAASAIDDVMITNGKCDQAPVWPSSTLLLRLVGGSAPTEGHVEVLHDGQWGSICSEQFGKKEAKVICGILGYGTEYAERRRDAYFAKAGQEVGTMIWLERLACSGKETDLAQCIVKGETWADTNCTHEQDAGVICSGVPLMSSTTTKAPPTTKMMATSTVRPSKPTPPVSLSTTSTLSTPTPSPTPAPVVPSVTMPSSTVSRNTPVPSTNDIIKSTPKTIPKPVIQPTSLPTEKSTATPILKSTLTPVSKPSHKPTDKPTATSLGSSGMTPSSTPTTTTTEHKDFYVTPSHVPKATVSTGKPAKMTPTEPVPSTPEKTNPDIVSLPPEVESYTPGGNVGVAIGVIFALLIAATGVGILLYKRRQKGKKSTYITFGNPSYSREHLPANDFSLESPLTLSSNGYTVLA